MATSTKRGPKAVGLEPDSERVNYTVDSMTRRRLRVLGLDNESQGVRYAARAAYDLYQRGRIGQNMVDTPQIDLLVEHLRTGDALSQAASIRLAEMRQLLADVHAVALGVPDEIGKRLAVVLK